MKMEVYEWILFYGLVLTYKSYKQKIKKPLRLSSLSFTLNFLNPLMVLNVSSIRL
jgi:hypothetical protein